MLLLLLLLFQLQSIASLQPAFRRLVIVWLAQLVEILRDAADRRGLAILCRMVVEGEVSQGWTGREERKKIGRELVRHGDDDNRWNGVEMKRKERRKK